MEKDVTHVVIDANRKPNGLLRVVVGTRRIRRRRRRLQIDMTPHIENLGEEQEERRPHRGTDQTPNNTQKS